VAKGPNTKMIGGTSGSFLNPETNYLALRWFFNNNYDAYN
jgi:hypothetical protein